MKHLTKRSAVVFLWLCTCSLAMAGVVIDKKGRYGLTDNNEELIVKYGQYDYIGSFSDFGLAIIRKGKFVGFIDKQGREIIPCDQAFAFQLFADGSQSTLFSAKGVNNSIENNTQSCFATIFYEDVCNNNNSQLVIIKFPKYAAKAGVSSTLGMPDIQKTNINTIHNRTYYTLQGDLIFDMDDRKRVYAEAFNIDEKDVFKKQNRILWFFCEEGAPVCNNMRLHYVYRESTRSDSILVADVYYNVFTKQITAKYVCPFPNVFLSYKDAEVLYDKKLRDNVWDALIDYGTDNGYNCQHYNYNYATIKNMATGTLFLIDTMGHEINKFHTMYPFKDGYMVIRSEDGLYGLADSSLNISIPYSYKYANHQIQTNNYWIVGNDKQRYGVVNIYNDSIIPLVYDYVTFKGNGFFDVRQDGKSQLWKDSVPIFTHSVDKIYNVYDGICCLLRNNNKFQVYNIEHNCFSDMYDGFKNVYEASEEHGKTIIQVYNIPNKNDTLWGYVNAFSEIVVPCLFDKRTASKAFVYNRNLPTRTWSDIDIYRLRLRCSRRERTYKLDAIIPDNEWDY